MRLIAVLALVLASAAAFAQPGGGRAYAQGGRGNPQMQRQMPPEERERLRRDVYDSSRENARRQPQYDPRRAPQPLPPDERERLRRDIRDANRDLERRR